MLTVSRDSLAHAVLETYEVRCGTGSCPLVLGECVQGKVRGGPHFLITSPVAILSRAEFVVDPRLDSLAVEPEHCTKSLRAVSLYLASQGLPQKGVLKVTTGAQVSLGFGTSTADITASLRAVAEAWQRRLSPETVSRIAAGIEPTDGSMYPGSVAFAHREGRLLERFGRLPHFTAVATVCGDAVDTLTFDKRRVHFRYPAHAEATLRTAWRMVREAARTRSVSLLGQAGTLSAGVNQMLLHKELFEEARPAARSLGAEGVMVAHSGALLSFVLDPSRPDFAARRDRVGRFFEDAGLSWFEVANR